MFDEDEVNDGLHDDANGNEQSHLATNFRLQEYRLGMDEEEELKLALIASLE